MEFSPLLPIFLHVLFFSSICCKTHYHVFKVIIIFALGEVEDIAYTRLCKTKDIMLVNRKFPGPTLYVHKGDKMTVKVINSARHNVTIHWHGVEQPRNPWSDGTNLITQCAIRPGASFTYKVIFSKEEGTVWWHAHNEYHRATVHGAIVIYPKLGTTYPFPKPSHELILILGVWWIADVNTVLEESRKTGGEPNSSDAYTINGQPGDLYPCSSHDTYRITVEHEKTVLLRLVNAALNDAVFFSIAKHPVVVVGSDGSYTKPFSTDYVMLVPGETVDLLLHANKNPNFSYYAMGWAYTPNHLVDFNSTNTTTTAILQYINQDGLESPTPLMPDLPPHFDDSVATNFSFAFRSLADADHPVDIPKQIDERLIITVSVNELPCESNSSCTGANGTRYSSSLNNISFVGPSSFDILSAYYYKIPGVYDENFPKRPLYPFNYTKEDLPLSSLMPEFGTKLTVFKYGTTVEVVFQGTSLVKPATHPMHLHGYSFYVVGKGYGNFNDQKDPMNYNLEDAPLKNTFILPPKGWFALRFVANNPGVWYLHCHFESHVEWGMNTVFIVKDGYGGPRQKMLPPPRRRPSC